MTSKELRKVKERVAKTLSKRSGIGAVDMYSGQVMAVKIPRPGEAVDAETGRKIIGPLLAIVGDRMDREHLRELGGLVDTGKPIPPAFTLDGMCRVCDILDADVDDDANRGTKHEVTHCAGVCTGICTGMCFGTCSSCTGCGNDCAGSCGEMCRSTSTTDAHGNTRS